MSLTKSQIKAVADTLFHAEIDQKQIGLLSETYPKMTLDNAYAVQAALIALKRSAGRRVIGWKIGQTSHAMQNALRINTPDSGVLMDDMAYADASEIPAAHFIQPRVEAEIAFIMQAPLKGKHVTRAHVLAATAAVAPAIEILDTRILRADPATGKLRTAVDTVADNAGNGGLILGAARHRLDEVDLRRVGAIVKRNGKVEETGLGAGVLDDPVTAVLWLVHRLAEHGAGLAPDDIVLSGSFIRPVEAPAGSVIEADFGAFGMVSCSFE